MSSKEYFEKLKKEWQNLDNDQLLTPYIPISEYLQEAEDLYQVAKKDSAELVKAGITKEMTESLNERTGACRYAQSLWSLEQNERSEATKSWKEKSPVAFELRDELVHTFFYAFRKDESLIQQVEEINEGYSNADMIQDLIDLSQLGKKHTDLLSAIAFDLSKLDKAGQMSDDMADLLAMSNGDRFTKDENKLNRDRAYTYLKDMVDEIREAGKFIFWKDENKARKYRSKYMKRKRARLKTEKENVSSL